MPVIHLDIEIDTQCADVDNLRACLFGWSILHSEALLNLRWEDFSARTFVEELGLRNAQWTTTGDDTPGTLYLSVARRGDIEIRRESCFCQIEGVEVWSVNDDESSAE